MNNNLQKLAPAWHGEAKEIIAANFLKDHAIFLDSTKRAVWWGLFFNHIKFRGDKKTGDGSIPHGKFGPWLKENAPKEISWMLANTYMRLGAGVCEKGKFQIIDFLQFAQNGSLPLELLKLVEGKTQAQLFLDFKNCDADGNPLKSGCAPGKRGKLTPEEIADIEDPLFEIENDLISITDEKDPTFADVKSARLLRFRNALRACLDRADHILKARKAA